MPGSTRRAWPTTRKRPTMPTRCSSSRPPPGTPRQRAAHIARRPRSTGGHCDSSPPATWRGALSCCAGARVSATRSPTSTRSARCSRLSDCYRRLGDRLGEGATLRSLGGSTYCHGDVTRSTQLTVEAVEVLEQLEPGRELAHAYASMSSSCMNAEDAPGTFAWGAKAVATAERLDDVELRIAALNDLGTMEFLAGLSPAGRRSSEASSCPSAPGSTTTPAALSFTCAGSPLGCAATTSPRSTCRRVSTTARRAISICTGTTCSRMAREFDSIALGGTMRPTTPGA